MISLSFFNLCMYVCIYKYYICTVYNIHGKYMVNMFDSTNPARFHVTSHSMTDFLQSTLFPSCYYIQELPTRCFKNTASNSNGFLSSSHASAVGGQLRPLEKEILRWEKKQREAGLAQVRHSGEESTRYWMIMYIHIQSYTYTYTYIYIHTCACASLYCIYTCMYMITVCGSLSWYLRDGFTLQTHGTSDFHPHFLEWATKYNWLVVTGTWFFNGI